MTYFFRLSIKNKLINIHLAINNKILYITFLNYFKLFTPLNY